ncbi:MAG: glycosyltransferase [Planctomycetota bacterium]|nr:glycosyltransferase [Planctomycetota bacterium]
MKILHVVHRFPEQPSGGTERYVAAVAGALREAGHDVRIACGSFELGDPEVPVPTTRAGLPVYELRRNDVYFEAFGKTWHPQIGDGFRRLLGELRPDVVHVHHWIGLTTDLVRIARGEGVPVVACTAHDHWAVLANPVRPIGLDVPEAPPPARWMGETERSETFAFHRAEFLDELRAAHVRLAPSAAHAASLAALAEGDMGGFAITPPPLLTKPPRLRPKAARGRRLLFWGSLYPAKGIELLLDALASIGSGYELHVCGTAPDPAYGELLARRAAAFPVVFHGAFDVRRLGEIDADFAVIPAASHESYGLVLDEAQCLGLPVLAADVPAFREHADPNGCAFFAPNDPGSLAVLLLDTEQLSRLRSPAPAGRSADDAAADLLAAYADARAGRHAPSGEAPVVTADMRARYLFRQSERRLWSSLQHGGPEVPPEDYLMPPSGTAENEGA